MSRDTNRLLGHADEADGIEEYDNPLPDWWLGMFWLTILWAIGYLAWFTFTDQSQISWYEDEVAAADERWADQASAVIEFAYSDEAAAAGAEVYATYCLVCHGAELDGGIGVSFVDTEWVHGGQSADVIRTIRAGVLDKGMPAWDQILTPEQVNQVASYILARHAEATGRSMDEITAPPTGAESPSGEAGPGA